MSRTAHLARLVAGALGRAVVASLSLALLVATGYGWSVQQTLTDRIVTSDAIAPDRRTRARAAVHRPARRPGQPHRRGRHPAAAGAARRAARRRGRGPAAYRHDHPAARAGRAGAAPSRSPSRATRSCRSPTARHTQDQLGVRPGSEDAEESLRRRASPAPTWTGGPARPAAARWSPPSRSSPGPGRPLRGDQPGRLRRDHRGDRRRAGVPARPCGRSGPASTSPPGRRPSAGPTRWRSSGSGTVSRTATSTASPASRPSSPVWPAAALGRDAGRPVSGRRLVDVVTRYVVLDRGWDLDRLIAQFRRMSGGDIPFRTIPTGAPTLDTPVDGIAVEVNPAAGPAFVRVAPRDRHRARARHRDRGTGRRPSRRRRRQRPRRPRPPQRPPAITAAGCPAWTYRRGHALSPRSSVRAIERRGPGPDLVRPRSATARGCSATATSTAACTAAGETYGSTAPAPPATAATGTR